MEFFRSARAFERSLEDIFQNILRIGRAAQAPERAEALVDAQKKLAALLGRPPVSAQS